MGGPHGLWGPTRRASQLPQTRFGAPRQAHHLGGAPVTSRLEGSRPGPPHASVRRSDALTSGICRFDISNLPLLFSKRTTTDCAAAPSPTRPGDESREWAPGGAARLGLAKERKEQIPWRVLRDVPGSFLTAGEMRRKNKTDCSRRFRVSVGAPSLPTASPQIARNPLFRRRFRGPSVEICVRIDTRDRLNNRH